MSEKIKVLCKGCGITQEYDGFVQGETICPRCGIASLFDTKRGNEPFSLPLPLEDKTYKVCNSCNAWWKEENIKCCPRCGRNEIHAEIIKA